MVGGHPAVTSKMKCARMHRFAVIVVSLSLLPAPSVWGQAEEVDGRLNAYVCEELPSPLRTDVRTLDDAPRYLKFKNEFSAKMRANGMDVAGDAPLQLILHMETEQEVRGSGEGDLAVLAAAASFLDYHDPSSNAGFAKRFNALEGIFRKLLTFPSDFIEPGAKAF